MLTSSGDHYNVSSLDITNFYEVCTYQQYNGGEIIVWIYLHYCIHQNIHGVCTGKINIMHLFVVQIYHQQLCACGLNQLPAKLFTA